MARDRSEEIPKESKIPMLSAGAASAAAEEVGLPAQMAELNIFRALLHDPELAKAVSDVLLTLLFRGKLDARLRELIIMRIGWATGSVYEWTQHWRIARQLGVEEADLLALRDWRSSDRFGEPEQAILAATDETLETGTISAETWKRCEAQLGSTEERLELAAAIGTWSLISSVVRSLGIPLEEGVAPWPPDGVGP
jgi:alkylhydroperoxidase family enzyme